MVEVTWTLHFSLVILRGLDDTDASAEKRSAGNPSLDLYLVLQPESCLQRRVPSKENLVGFERGLGLVKSFVCLITCGNVYPPQRKVRNLELHCFSGGLRSTLFCDCLLYGPL